MQRPAPSSDRRVPVSAPFDDAHFWDDTESDRNFGHTAQNDTWTSAEQYPRSTRAGAAFDMYKRLYNLRSFDRYLSALGTANRYVPPISPDVLLSYIPDDTNDGHEPTRPLLVRSQTTTTSTLATFNRLRNRLHHNSSATRLASSNSLVTENSSEFRRRSARQEWMERLSRLNDERAQAQSEIRPSRAMVSEISSSGEPRRPELRVNTRMSSDRRLYGSVEGSEEARRASEPDAFAFHNLDRFASLPRHMQWEYRPIPRSSSPVQTSSTRPAANVPAPPAHWEYRPIRSTSPTQTNATRPTLNVPAPPAHWEYRPVPRPNSPVQTSPARSAPNVPPPPGLGTERYSRFLDYLHEHPDSSPIYPSPFSFGPIDVPHRASEEPAVLRNTRDPQSEWFSRRRHSARSSQMHPSLWGEIDGPDFGIERPAEAGRAAGLGLRTDSIVGEREPPSTAGLRSSLDRHARIDEPPRISPGRPISPYLIDVPPLPSPDLSDLLDNVPRSPQTAMHEERLVASRPISELSSSSRIRRRSPSPAVRSQARTRSAVRSSTGFANIDPELFAPGPYRNTFQSLQRRREPSPQASQPPTIPPFSFESNVDREARSARRHHHAYSESYDSRSFAQVRAENESEPRPPHFWRSSIQGGGRHYPRNEWDSSSSSPPLLTPTDEHHRHRQQPTPSSDLHSFLSRHVRLEGARMERFAEAAQLSEASSNASRFNHAIEVLRGDGLSRRQSLDRASGGTCFMVYLRVVRILTCWIGGRAGSDASRERSSLDWLAVHHHHPHARPRRARYVFTAICG